MISEDLPRVKDRVRYILEKYPAARNSDKSLRFFYIREFNDYKGTFLEWMQIEKDNLETVRRTRQQIQEEGYFLPTDPTVIKERDLEASAVRDALRKLKGGQDDA